MGGMRGFSPEESRRRLAAAFSGAVKIILAGFLTILVVEGVRAYLSWSTG